MQLHEIIHGFRVERECELRELDGRLWELRHERSGAGLVWIQRPDENKTFGVAFATLPEDDTGVFHILEHSVLCGSDKYPVKEPFVELLKSSMNTFLNAITFPDKTLYPVSSRNGKDFFNLVSVYLDAVFHPLIYSRPEIFRQEGWRVEPGEDGNEPSWQGVVLNEMKGAYASADDQLDAQLMRALFPDTCYRFDAGGDPAVIPTLSYEQFTDSHRRFYSPSNALFVLDGELDIDRTLALIDDEYLSRMEPGPGRQQFEWQRPVKAAPVRAYYEISPDEPAEKRARLAWGYVLGRYDDIETAVAVRALADLLCGSNQSPLSRAVLSAGLAQDVNLSVVDGILQPFAVLELRDMDESRAAEAAELVRAELQRQADGALDHRQLAATLANLEFQLRERDYGSMPQGLVLGLMVLESWLYGGRPEHGLEVGGLFASLNRRLEEGWFEELLRRKFLESEHCCEVLLLPSATLGEQRRAAEAERLRASLQRLTGAQREAIMDDARKLHEWQAAPDSPEAMATLPKLELTDISPTPERIPMEVDAIGGVPLLRHIIPSSGIVYCTLYFDVSDLSARELSAASLLCDLLGELDTRSHSTLELQRLIKLNMGTLNFHISVPANPADPTQYRALLCASFSAVEAKLPQAVELVTEILTSTRCDLRAQLAEMLRQLVNETRSRVARAGNGYGRLRAQAGASAQGAATEAVSGLTQYFWLRDELKAFETGSDELTGTLSALAQTIFTTGRLTLSVTGAQDDDALAMLLSRLPGSERRELCCAVTAWEHRREGIEIPADIAFACIGGRFPDGGRAGAVRVMKNIVSLAFLWNSVRVHGGAYGTGLNIDSAGNASFSSFRDPNAKRSLGCYRQTVSELAQFCAARPDLTGFIIKTISDTDPLLLPRAKGQSADIRYFSGISYEDECRQRREMLATTPEQLAALTAPLQALLDDSSVCVIGPRTQLEACGTELDSILTL